MTLKEGQMKAKIFILRLVFILLLIALNAHPGFSKQEIWASSYFFPEMTSKEKQLAINSIKQQDEVTEASVQVFQSASTIDELIYFDEIKERAASNPRIDYYPICSKDSGKKGIDEGRITGETFEKYGVACGSLFYLSGPGEMIPELKTYLLSRNVPEKQIKYEMWW